jgi:hypothetical protein
MQRALATMIEAVQMIKRLEECVLHKVLGIGEVARPAGQSATSPAPECRQMAGEQVVQSGPLAGPRERASKVVVDAANGWVAGKRGNSSRSLARHCVRFSSPLSS